MPQGKATPKRSEVSPKRRRAWKAHALLPEASLKAFFASGEEAYTSLEKRARVEGRLREKEEKEERLKEKEEK